MSDLEQRAEEVAQYAFMGYYIRDPEGDFVELNDKYGVEKNAFVAAIVQLAKDYALEVVGADETINLYTPPQHEITKGRNELRAQQRATTKGGES